jgi:hypothetical protein
LIELIAIATERIGRLASNLAFRQVTAVCDLSIIYRVELRAGRKFAPVFSVVNRTEADAVYVFALSARPNDIPWPIRPVRASPMRWNANA